MTQKKAARRSRTLAEWKEAQVRQGDGDKIEESRYVQGNMTLVYWVNLRTGLRHVITLRRRTTGDDIWLSAQEVKRKMGIKGGGPVRWTEKLKGSF